MKKLIPLILLMFILIACNNSKKYNVTFVNGETKTTIKVSEGELVKKPKDPVKEGYTFMYWELTNREYKFDIPVSENITLVAKWRYNDGKTYNVNFVVDNVVIETLKIETNNKASKPKDPIKEDLEFIGWYLGNELYDFDSLVTKNIMLHAKFKVISDSSLISEFNDKLLTFNNNLSGKDKYITYNYLYDNSEHSFKYYLTSDSNSFLVRSYHNSNNEETYLLFQNEDSFEYLSLYDDKYGLNVFRYFNYDLISDPIINRILISDDNYLIKKESNTYTFKTLYKDFDLNTFSETHHPILNEYMNLDRLDISEYDLVTINVDFRDRLNINISFNEVSINYSYSELLEEYELPNGNQIHQYGEVEIEEAKFIHKENINYFSNRYYEPEDYHGYYKFFLEKGHYEYFIFANKIEFFDEDYNEIEFDIIDRDGFNDRALITIPEDMIFYIKISKKKSLTLTNQEVSFFKHS